MIVHDYRDSTKVEHPDGRQWLTQQGYQLRKSIEDGDFKFEIFSNADKTSWATYHPSMFGMPNTEVIYFHIPTKKEAANLIYTAIQMIEPLSQLAAIRSGQIPESMQVMIINSDSDIDAAAQRITDSMFPPDESKGTT